MAEIKDRHFLMQGRCFITNKIGQSVITVLGSCVSACIWDPSTGIGGMNHFMLPSGKRERNAEYGDYAMPLLLSSLLKHGAQVENLQATLFGGNRTMVSNNNIGQKNMDFASEYLSSRRIQFEMPTLQMDGSTKIEFWPSTGRVIEKFIEIELRSPPREDFRSQFGM